jgi:hypothetical protein
MGYVVTSLNGFDVWPLWAGIYGTSDFFVYACQRDIYPYFLRTVYIVMQVNLYNVNALDRVAMCVAESRMKMSVVCAGAHWSLFTLQNIRDLLQ